MAVCVYCGRGCGAGGDVVEGFFVMRLLAELLEQPTLSGHYFTSNW